MGLLEMKTAHVHTSLRAVYKNRFPASALWNIAVIVNGSSCSSLSSLHHRAFFPFSLLFHSVFPKPWRCLWPVSAPSVMWGFCWSAWLGSGPALGPSHLAQRASRPGLSSLEACVFWPRGKACMPLSIHQWGKGVRSFFSEVPMPSGTLVSRAVYPGKRLQTHRSQRAHEGLFRDIHSSLRIKHLHVVCFRNWMKTEFMIQSTESMMLIY